MVSASCQKSLVTKWRNCTFLNSLQSSLSLPRNKHMRPRLKVPFKVCTTVTGLQVSVDGVVAGSCCGTVLTAANKKETETYKLHS